MIDIDAYFARIGHNGARTPTLALLREITVAHPSAIPFENLDVTAGKVPQLDLAAIDNKLVHSRRGGYCYEQNTLLQAVLTGLGFCVIALLARVRFGIPADLITALSTVSVALASAKEIWETTYKTENNKEWHNITNKIQTANNKDIAWKIWRRTIPTTQ